MLKVTSDAWSVAAILSAFVNFFNAIEAIPVPENS
jgi:hypothetical protein